MIDRKRLDAHPVHQKPVEGFSVSDVEVRLAKPEERCQWDALMAKNHYLGFRQLAGRGLRYIATCGSLWLGLAAWQSGAFKCAPRDRWIGWKPEQQFERLHLVANNTRFLILGKPGVFPNLASSFLSQMTRRLPDDWEAAYGHKVLVAESFYDPERFSGTMYKAAGWQELGETKGFARITGQYTDPHGKPKRIVVTPLRRDAPVLLSRTEPLPGSVEPPADPDLAPRDLETMRSLYAELSEIQDYRRAQGRKHSVASVLTVHILAELANMRGCTAVEQFASNLTQEELKAVGAWKNPKTGQYVPVSKSTIHRVVQSVDPDALQAVVNRYARPRLPFARALAADGKRIRGANRNGENHYETVALVDQVSGAPYALLGFGDEGGELAAMHDLLERTDIRGKIITLDALHTVRSTATRITRCCGADYVFTVKANAEETFGILSTINWEADDTRHFTQEIDKAHGRIEQRSISVMTPLKGTINYPGVNQVARITRYREPVKNNGDDADKDHTETAYIITSLDAAAASPEDLLQLNRGHWAVENQNHRHRDCLFGEDACLTRTGHGPTNRASLNTIALAVLFSNRRTSETFAETRRRLQLNRSEAFSAVLEA